MFLRLPACVCVCPSPSARKGERHSFAERKATHTVPARAVAGCGEYSSPTLPLSAEHDGEAEGVGENRSQAGGSLPDEGRIPVGQAPACHPEIMRRVVNIHRSRFPSPSITMANPIVSGGTTVGQAPACHPEILRRVLNIHRPHSRNVKHDVDPD